MHLAGSIGDTLELGYSKPANAIRDKDDFDIVLQTVFVFCWSLFKLSSNTYYSLMVLSHSGLVSPQTMGFADFTETRMFLHKTGKTCNKHHFLTLVMIRFRSALTIVKT